MGLFSFVKEAGEKLWDTVSGNDQKAQADTLQAHINRLGLQGPEKVDIQVSPEGTVDVSGNITTQETKEKILVALGNVAGVSKVNDNTTVTRNAPESRYYTVKPGDTLSAISRRMYGASDEYPRIFEANKPMLKSPEKIYPGQVLIIPGKQ